MKLSTLLLYILNIVLILLGGLYWAYTLLMLHSMLGLWLVIAGMFPAFMFVLMILNSKLYDDILDTSLGFFLVAFSMMSLICEIFVLGYILIDIFSRIEETGVNIVSALAIIIMVLYFIGLATGKSESRAGDIHES